DVEGRGKRSCELRPRRSDVDAVAEDDVDLIDLAVLRQVILRRCQIHHRELPAERGRQSLRLEKPANGELADAARRGERERADSGKPISPPPSVTSRSAGPAISSNVCATLARTLALMTLIATINDTPVAMPPTTSAVRPQLARRWG